MNFEHLFVAVEWLGGPVLGNLGEQPVLYGIPFGGAGRVVSDGDGDAEGIAYLALKLDLPGPRKCNGCYRRSRPEPKVWGQGHSDMTPPVSTR